MVKKITLELDCHKIVSVLSREGGRNFGECIACGAMGGLIPRLGLPHGSSKARGLSIIHRPECPMNDHLNEDGSLK